MRRKVNKHQSLCWTCKKVYGGCSWSKYFIPVKGWTAIPTQIKVTYSTNYYTDDSYDVYACPEYERG